MMLQKTWLLFLLTVTLLSCSMQKSTESWSEGMQGMAAAFRELLPYIYNDNRYAHPRNKLFIQTRLAELNHHSDSLDRHVAQGLSGGDPLVKVGLEGLKRNIEKSTDSFLVDNHEYSQQLLQSSVSYCVKCHMRTNMGRSFVVFESFGQGAFQDVEPIHLARAQIAMREFGKARETLIKAIQSKKASRLERQTALEVLMTLNIRNENNFKQALDDLKLALSEKNIFPQPSLASAWLSYLKTQVENKLGQELSLESSFKALKKQTPKPSTFVRDLHISRVLHGSLQSTRERSIRARVLEALGSIYQTHESLSSWELPDRYFEACINEFPHSQQAKRCYYSLEKSVRDSHRLTPNSDLPAKERTYLLKYKALAESTAPAGQSIQEHQRF